MTDDNKKILTYKDLKPRYNNAGEWKPLTYSGNLHDLNKEINELVKDEYDKRIYGALYYIKATSCVSIEFIVKTYFEIPGDFQQIGSQYGKIQLHKVNFSADYVNIENMQVYDGTLELPGDSIEDIKSGLAFIDVTLHRLVFGMDTKLEWFMKYPHHDNNPKGLLHLTDEDMSILKEYLTENLKGEDSLIFDVVISWYINGSNSNNVFISFLNYCIAMESLADSFLSGKMEISAKFGVQDEVKNKQDLVSAIKEKHDELYESEPEKFLREAYSELIGIQRKLRKAMEIVFGEEHKYISLFFDKKDGYRMYDLRSNLAHGSFNSLDVEHKKIIESRLVTLKEIAYDFIYRISTGTLKDELPKKIKPQVSISFLFSTPRGTGIASSLNLFPNKDWKIKPEWLF